MLVAWGVGATLALTAFAVRWTQAARLARAAMPLQSGREVTLLRALEASMGLGRPLPVRVMRGSTEPAVFGVVRPVLLWPLAMSQRLSDQQIETILIHELAHARRRDNLVAMIHAAVQAVWWFHPIVWWIGGRLVEERERACDEQVVRLGRDRQVYAESLLRACCRVSRASSMPVTTCARCFTSILRLAVRCHACWHSCRCFEGTRRCTRARPRKWMARPPWCRSNSVSRPACSCAVPTSARCPCSIWDRRRSSYSAGSRSSSLRDDSSAQGPVDRRATRAVLVRAVADPRLPAVARKAKAGIGPIDSFVQSHELERLELLEVGVERPDQGVDL